ncbi:MAG: hypothetical protein ACPIOQ_65600, partial [Promethearchaeia archaeon]
MSGDWNLFECASGKAIGARYTLNLKESATSYESVGKGWCIDDTKADLQRHLPALWKQGARPAELKALCDKYQDCVAVDWDNNGNGHLRFSSATALNAVNEPGWGKWSDGCKEGCVVKTAGDGGQGKCHVKRDVIQARYYLQGPDAEPHAFVTFDGKIATYVEPSVSSGALLPNGDIQWSHEAAKWCFRKDGGKPCKECEAGKTLAASATACDACPAGKVSAAGSAQGCVSCEAGKYVAQTKDATKAACDACPAGKTSTVGSGACIDMPAPAPTDTPFVVSVTVTMPYTKAAFEAHQDKYRAGVASAAGVNTADVVIVSVVEVASRRAGGKVQVETEIRAADAAASGKISSTL